MTRLDRFETYLGAKTVLGGGEGELGVKGRKREAKEHGISKKERLAVRAAVPRSRRCRLRCVCKIWSQGSSLGAVRVDQT